MFLYHRLGTFEMFYFSEHWFIIGSEHLKCSISQNIGQKPTQKSFFPFPRTWLCSEFQNRTFQKFHKMFSLYFFGRKWAQESSSSFPVSHGDQKASWQPPLCISQGWIKKQKSSSDAFSHSASNLESLRLSSFIVVPIRASRTNRLKGSHDSFYMSLSWKCS